VSPNGGPRIGVGCEGCQHAEVLGRNGVRDSKFVRSVAIRRLDSYDQRRDMPVGLASGAAPPDRARIGHIDAVTVDIRNRHHVDEVPRAA